MKSVSRDRNGFSFPEFLAYCAVSAVLRPYRRCSRYAVALIVENWAERAVYAKAATGFMFPDLNDRWRHRGAPLVFDGTKPAASLGLLLEEFERGDVVAIFESEAAIPDEVAGAFDLVSTVSAPTIRQYRGVVRWLYGVEITEADAELLARESWQRLRILLRQGRSVGRVLEALRKVQKHEAAGQKVVNRDYASDPSLEDLHGFGDAKEWGLNLCQDIADFKRGLIRWNQVDRGVLLTGPPGVGKTIFAMALGRTCGVPVILGSAARWQARGHLGDLLKAMRKAFEEAQKKAPSILFIDEIDSFGDREAVSSDHSDYVRQVINGLLECLDGAEKREGVVVVGACNQPRLLDPAAKRPGRLDRQIEIPLPDADARVAILTGYLGRALPDKFVPEFVRRTTGFTGADIERVFRDASREARRARRELQPEHLFAVLPPEEVLTPGMARCVALHELGHAAVSIALDTDRLVEVTLYSRGHSPGLSALGGASFRRDGGRRRNRRYYLDLISTYLGGIAAETVFFGDFSDGAGGEDQADLSVATNLVVAMETHFGFGSSLASLGEVSQELLRSIKLSDPVLMRKVDEVLKMQFSVAVRIVEAQREGIERLAAMLLERRQLTGEEVREALSTFPVGSFCGPTPKAAIRED